MIPYNDILVNPIKIYSNVKNIFDEYIENIENNQNLKENYYKESLEKLRTNYFWFISSSTKICSHVYKNGKREGQICGAKVFIKTDNKLNKYLCSRHCRDYHIKSRKLKEYETYCNFIRNNGNQCKHKCNKYEKFCYIHKNLRNLDEIKKIKKLEKLKRLRKMYFQKKRKNNYNFSNYYNKYDNMNYNIFDEIFTSCIYYKNKIILIPKKKGKVDNSVT